MPGRNDPCPCGSGKKYKKCCALKTEGWQSARQEADLGLAITRFENGEFRAAAVAARDFIKSKPDEPMAWQVLGVSLYYLGDLVEAEKAFREVIKYDKGNPDALNNLGLVLFEQTKLEEAEKYCQKALKIQPDMSGAHNNLGNIYRAQCEFIKSEQSYQTAIRYGMLTPEVYCNLGTVQQEKGDCVAAEIAFKKALELDSNSVAANSNLGAIYLERGDFDQAFEKLQTANKIDPNDTDVLCNIAKYWQELGQQVKAEKYYLDAIKLNPSEFTVNYRIALYYHSLLQLNNARKFCLRALESNPIHIESLSMLGEIALAQAKVVEASEFFEKALKLGGDRKLEVVKSYSDYLVYCQRGNEARQLWNLLAKRYPGDLKVKIGMAQFFQEIGDFDTAESIYQAESDRSKQDKVVLFNWAYMEEMRHNLEKAKSLVKKVLETEPEHTSARILLVNLYEREKEYQLALDELKKIDLEKNKYNNYLVYSTLFQQARILDKTGEYEKAFDALLKANEIKSIKLDSPYSIEKDKQLLTREVEAFSRKNLEMLPVYFSENYSEEVQPVFIVGFPRSGTSLLEQILASHTMVSAGGELKIIDEVKTKIKNLTRSKLDYPENLLDLKNPVTQDSLKKLHDFYLSRIEENKLVESGSTFVTDKLPHNLVNLGLINLLFPHSPIIHITRHPMDACLSAFMADFAHGHKYTSSIKNTCTHYALLMQAAEHYKSVLNMNYLQIRYEDLVEETESKVREVLDFIGLPFEEACLKFNESKRVVKTASHAQVTQKIYTSSRYRYKNYYKQLEPYADILKDAMDNFGYRFEP